MLYVEPRVVEKPTTSFAATVLGDAIVDETTGEEQPALIVVFALDDTDDDSLTWPKLWALPQEKCDDLKNMATDHSRITRIMKSPLAPPDLGMP